VERVRLWDAKKSPASSSGKVDVDAAVASKKGESLSLPSAATSKKKQHQRGGGKPSPEDLVGEKKKTPILWSQIGREGKAKKDRICKRSEYCQKAEVFVGEEDGSERVS